MSKYTDRLWRDIVREHGADLRGMERSPGGPRHRVKRLLAGTGLVGVAGAGAVLAIALGAASTTPAFAVTRNGDGTYSVGINAISAIPAANARLRALGLRARLVAVESGCSNVAVTLLPQHVIVPALMPAAAQAKAMAAAAKINPAAIPHGRTLVVPAFRMGNIVRLAQAKAVSGLAPSCLPTPARVCFSAASAAAVSSKTGTGSAATTTGTGTDASTSTGTTTTGTATTGTTTAAVPVGPKGPGYAVGPKGPATLPAGGVMRCFAPPPMFCGGPASSGSASSKTTGTTTTGSTTTGTGTTTTGTGTATTGTATTTKGTTTGPVATAVPGRIAKGMGCAAPPPCAAGVGVTGAVTRLTPAQVALMRAKFAQVRVEKLRAFAQAPAPSSSSSTSKTSTGTGTTTTGTGTTPTPATAPLPPKALRQVMPGPFALTATCGPVGATGLTGVSGPYAIAPAAALKAAIAARWAGLARAAAAVKAATAAQQSATAHASDRSGKRHTTRNAARHISKKHSHK